MHAHKENKNLASYLASSVSCPENGQRTRLLPAKGQGGKGHDLTLVLHRCTRFILGRDVSAVSLIYTLQRPLEGILPRPAQAL